MLHYKNRIIIHGQLVTQQRCHIRHTLTHHIANSPTENSSDIFSASGKFTHGYSTRHPIPPPTQLRHPLSVTANYGFNKISIIKLNLMTLICLEFIFGHMGQFTQVRLGQVRCTQPTMNYCVPTKLNCSLMFCIKTIP